MGLPELLVLVRHAESEGNIQSTAERAKSEIPTHGYALTDRGKQQALITGRYLQERFGFFDDYYASYYRRAKETLQLMYVGAKVYEDPRLAEGQRGIWHILTEEEIQERYPFEIARREREGLYHFRPWGGENWPDIELRIHSFLRTLYRDCVGRRVLIIVHGHWLILFQRLIHHFSIERTLLQYRTSIFENASVTIYRGQEREGKSKLVLQEENIIPWAGQL